MAVTVVVLAPSPLLTVTIEDRAGEPDIHVHAGGQGVWQARMLSSLRGAGGPHDDRIVPSTLYRRLTNDLQANGCTVAVDLAGERPTAVLDGKPALVKVSHEELIEDGRADGEEPPELVKAMRELHAAGAGIVVVSRAAEPASALVDDDIVAVRTPALEPSEPKGAGDSMTAGMVATLARGGSPLDALRTGAACGALNVVRRGLGTGNADAVAAIAERVELMQCDDQGRER